jgi:hypothetical protein
LSAGFRLPATHAGGLAVLTPPTDLRASPARSSDRPSRLALSIQAAKMKSRMLRGVATSCALVLAGCGDGTTAPPATPRFTVGGTVVGLSGSGLVLQYNGGANLAVSAGATSFTFPTQANEGTAYVVSVATQPSTPSQTCTVGNATGTIIAAVVSITVACTTNTYTVGGPIIGLSGSGLGLRLNSGDVLPITVGSTVYAFPAVASGTAFSIAVASQPASPAQTCTVPNGTGVVGAINLTSVAVNCATQPPTVSLTVTPAKVTVGQSATITWASTNALTCTASEAWTGQKALNGSMTFTPTLGGQLRFVIACSGGGRAVTQTAGLVVPMPVFPSSYENAKNIVLDDPNIPVGQKTNIPNPKAFGLGFAFADFLQEGSYTAIVMMHAYPGGFFYPDGPGKLFFLKRTGAQTWTDISSGLVSDQTGCTHPRKALVADFNGDAKPDVFFVCQGTDAPPFPGEIARIVLSQPDGTYTNTAVESSLVGFTHGGAAADINGDGKTDVVLTGGPPPVAGPYALMGRGDGTFTRDVTRLPVALKNKWIFSLELIDSRRTGRYDLFVGAWPADATGGDPLSSQSWPNGVYNADTNGSFLTSPYVAFPNPPGSTGIRYRIVLDFLLLNGFMYLNRGDVGLKNVAVQKMNLADLSITTIYEHFWPYTPDWCSWFPWIYATQAGRLVSQSMNVEYPISPLSCNSLSIPL